MISGNPATPPNSLGAAQNDPASPDSGSWKGRAIKVLKAVGLFVSGVVALPVVILATGVYLVATLLGAVFVVPAIPSLFDNIIQAEDASESDSQSPTDDGDKEEVLGYIGTCPITRNSTYESVSGHFREEMFYRNPSDPVNTTRSERGNEIPGNRYKPGLADLEMCKIKLRLGQAEVNTVLSLIFYHCLKDCRDLTHPREQLDILKVKEPFDDKLFLELAQILRVEQSIINGHQRIDKSEKIALLERAYKQLAEVPELQRNSICKLKEDFENINQNLHAFVLPDSLISESDAVSDIDIATMKEHVDAFDALLSRIDKSAIAELIRADEKLKRRMSKAAEAVQKCRNILHKPHRKWS
ncbi:MULTISPECIES: hypothetical protein [unclassified Endozoicomonas]|uniref:hypothetical protein n=1 Tax=unclassified Endozoicomonas TaxID=2644528 RepID=UPI003BB60588